MAGFDLRKYLDCFPEVCRKKFGRSWSWRSLEKDFEQLRTGKRWLVARDVVKLFERARTPFARYWPKPNEKDLDQILSHHHLVLVPVPPDCRELVERLLAVFHNIEIVSLVLRYVHPDRFGVFSTPVVDLLQIHRPTTVKLYLAFCDELRAWQEHFGLGSVAETEMALWAFHQIASGRTGLPADPRAGRPSMPTCGSSAGALLRRYDPSSKSTALWSWPESWRKSTRSWLERSRARSMNGSCVRRRASVD